MTGLADLAGKAIAVMPQTTGAALRADIRNASIHASTAGRHAIGAGCGATCARSSGRRSPNAGTGRCTSPPGTSSSRCLTIRTLGPTATSESTCWSCPRSSIDLLGQERSSITRTGTEPTIARPTWSYSSATFTAPTMQPFATPICLPSISLGQSPNTKMAPRCKRSPMPRVCHSRRYGRGSSVLMSRSVQPAGAAEAEESASGDDSAATLEE